MAIDLLASLALVACALAIAAAYVGRVSRRGRAGDARVERAGGSMLLGKAPMEGAYWALRPVGKALVALGVTADVITWSSLALAAAAGVSFAVGHFGVGAALMAVSALGDALDGMVARETGTASASGEVLDAAVDRYTELFFLGGVAFYGRASALLLVLAIAAIAGAFMVSYSTAKAEALGVTAPRGSMRREERAVYLVLGAVLVPVAAALAHRWALPPWTAHLPLFLSLGLVGIVGNLSAVRRLQAVAAAVRAPTSSSRARRLERDAHHAATGDAVR